ncbi:hypothetical protein TNCV_2735951 [Trichonephila clavipes]|nr:hypothetical protein TNCV_2735951 [Trichonephila clavipes]
MFTDESRFSLEPDDKRIRIWRKQETRNQPQDITEHHAFRGGSIMVLTVLKVGKRIPFIEYRSAAKWGLSKSNPKWLCRELSGVIGV